MTAQKRLEPSDDDNAAARNRAALCPGTATNTPQPSSQPSAQPPPSITIAKTTIITTKLSPDEDNKINNPLSIVTTTKARPELIKLNEPSSANKCHLHTTYSHDSCILNRNHPHQLSHQHTYPKISLQSLTSAGCIKEEEEYNSNNIHINEDDSLPNTAASSLDKRRLSAQYGNPLNTGLEKRLNRSQDFDDNASVQLYSPGNSSASGPGGGGTVGGGVSIPRTFSTSALKMKNRSIFWDRLHAAPRYSIDSKISFNWNICQNASFFLLM